ncbi:DUF4124 domain-containing protein [Comamonas sp. Tr-654]|nr:DUF4124 domain-containing protein [Comamonas sp. Tr-654]NIF82531.1 DUF4124 domain-containing protein [Comamonas sp. Tr-654]
MRLLSLALICTVLALPATAQVYRCKDSTGSITMSDKPCSVGQSGELLERKRSNEEIDQERMQAAEANERKYRQQLHDMQHSQLESQQRRLEHQSSGAQAVSPSQSPACKEARKELEFVSSVRTVSQDEKRMRTNAAISNVNAACDSNTPLMQEPQKVIVAPEQGHPLSHCDAGFCYDTNGNIYNRSGSFMTNQSGRSCQEIGNLIQCH